MYCYFSVFNCKHIKSNLLLCPAPGTEACCYVSVKSDHTAKTQSKADLLLHPLLNRILPWKEDPLSLVRFQLMKNTNGLLFKESLASSCVFTFAPNKFSVCVVF